MSLLAGTIAEVRTSGDDLNGGAFLNSGAGTDYSQQNVAQVVFDGSTITAATAGVSAALTVSGVTPDATWVDNHIQIASGTNFTAGLYRVLSVVGQVVTVDRNCTTGVGSGMVGKLGGALATLGGGAKFFSAIAGVGYFVKAGTYPGLSTSANVPGGRPTIAGSNGTNRSFVVGYDQVRGDVTGTRPIIAFSGTAFASTSLVTTTAGTYLYNIEIEGTSLGSSVTVLNTVGVFAYKCAFRGGTASTVMGSATTTGYLVDCEISNNAGAVGTACVDGPVIIGCYIHDGSGIGWSCNNSNGSVAICSIAENMVGNGFTTATRMGVVYNCTAYNTAVGFTNNTPIGSVLTVFINDLSYASTGNNFSIGGVGAQKLPPIAIFCAEGAAGGVGFGTQIASISKLGCFDAISDPFVAKASHNFGLNKTAGAGVLLRGTSDLGTFFGVTIPPNTVSHKDVGAVQHPDPVLPAPGDVVSGVQYGDGGTEFTGTFDQYSYGQSQLQQG